MLPITISTPKFLNLSVAATIDRPAVKIKAVHDDRTGRYVNASIAVEHPMVAVTPTLLSKMRLGTVRRDALRVALGEANGELARRAPVKTFFKGTAGRTVSDRVRLEPTPEHLENAALIYRLARLVGDFPVQAIGRSFGLEPEDAKRWAATARQEGVLS